MNKDALLHMPRLMATAKMRKVAIENAPALKRWEEGNRHFDSIEDRPYRVFMRCSIWFVALLLTIQFVVLFEERNYNVSSGVALWTIRS